MSVSHLSNIYDKTYLPNSSRLKTVKIFKIKNPSPMFHRVLITPLHLPIQYYILTHSTGFSEATGLHTPSTSHTPPPGKKLTFVDKLVCSQNKF